VTSARKSSSDASARPSGRIKEQPPVVVSVAPFVNSHGQLFLDVPEDFPSPALEERMSSIQQWVIFSDLHVSRRTLPICLEVLDRVKEEADKRNGGVIFLGDFWHSRGALPVEPLNAIVRSLMTWQVPTIMIPGNHDQVTVGGEEHSLVPLASVMADHALLITRPKLFLDALWIPYRRSEEAIRTALAEHSGAAKAVFCHVDIVGAQMNDSVQASLGLSPEIFPPHLRVFTGHYHKPHLVPGTSIRYVGSPYQVTRSEAGQQKGLVIVDRDWREVETVPMDVGPRHYAAIGLQSMPSQLRRGDRLQLKVSDAKDVTVQDTVSKLRSSGVDVDVQAEAVPKTPARISEADSLSPASVFEEYCSLREMDEEARQLGRDILAHLDVPAHVMTPHSARISFHSTTLEGYGPYQSQVTYPLKGRGVVLVTATNLDDNSCDSNGAGKSTLVMAPLWALTGSADPRPEGNSMKGLASELVNDRMGSGVTARVSVEGEINGQPFCIERRMGKGGHQLSFNLNGQDLTCQELKLTQQRIDDLIDTRLLTATVFHGQHSSAWGGLLAATDKGMKEELGKVMPMDVWLKALAATSKSLAETEKAAVQKQSKGESERGLVARVAEDMARFQQRVTQWSQQHELEIRKAENAVKEAKRLSPALKEQYVLLKGIVGSESEGWLDTWRVMAQRACDELNAEISTLEEASTSEAGRMEPDTQRSRGRGGQGEGRYSMAARTGAARSMSHSSANGRTSVMEVEDALLLSLKSAANEANVRMSEAQTRAVERRTRMNMRQKDVSQLIKVQREGSQGGVCSHCRQPIDIETIGKHIEEMKAEIELESAAAGQAEEAVGSAREELESAKKQLADREELLRKQAEERVLQARTEWLRTLNELRMRLQAAQSELTAARRACEDADRAEKDLQQERAKTNPHEGEYEKLEQDLRKHEEATHVLEDEALALKHRANMLQQVEEAFSRQGIQSYVIECGLSELESRATSYLEQLSGGALRLEISATKPKKTTRGGGGGAGSARRAAAAAVSGEALAGAFSEQIHKRIYVRASDGTYVPRSLRQLSGGQWRRQGLALTLAFADFCAQRTGIVSNVIVFDEILQHLDHEGRTRAGRLFRSLGYETVLVISQEDELGAVFDRIDRIVKKDDAATIEIS